MKKALSLLLVSAAFVVFVFSGCPNLPTDPPVPPVVRNPGDVWIEPADKTVSNGADLVFNIYLNSGTQKVAAYGMDISFDQTILAVNTGIGTNGIEQGADGFIAAVNSVTGKIVASGFDTAGKGPGGNLHLLKANFKAIKKGTANVEITKITLTDGAYATIGTPKGFGGTITVK